MCSLDSIKAIGTPRSFVQSKIFRLEKILSMIKGLGAKPPQANPETMPMSPTFRHELHNVCYFPGGRDGAACSFDDGFELIVVGPSQCGVVAQRAVVQTKLTEVHVHLRFYTAT